MMLTRSAIPSRPSGSADGMTTKTRRVACPSSSPSCVYGSYKARGTTFHRSYAHLPAEEYDRFFVSWICSSSILFAGRLLHILSSAAPKKAAMTIPQEVQPLFQPVQIGRFKLQHRIVYAPLTRNRAINTVPVPAMATYYSQRTTNGGLVLTEATCIMDGSYGYPHTPGIYTPEHLTNWKPVVEAVHEKGGVFFCQLWHCGRASHEDFQPDGRPPVGPSAIPVTTKYDVYTPKGGPFPYPTPRVATKEEIQAITQQYAQAAKNAIEVGFDGVEIHGANGYLLDQFLKDGTNKREDEYGGSIPNRARLMLEVVAAVVEAVGADRTGLRLSPFNSFLDAVDSTPYETNEYLVKELNKFGLAYLHFVEPRVASNSQGEDDPTAESLDPFKKICTAPFIAAGSYKRDTGAAAIKSGHADLICYGRLFLANPDLPKRFILNAPLNKYDRNTFYSQGMHGYIDYPTLEEVEQQGKEGQQPLTAADGTIKAEHSTVLQQE